MGGRKNNRRNDISGMYGRAKRGMVEIAARHRDLCPVPDAASSLTSEVKERIGDFASRYWEKVVDMFWAIEKHCSVELCVTAMSGI